ncbi:hypothetical protein KAR91_45970 [Candidatus Pacearchaeota archaeon]|nr:hypothetical protein [Candidatus Pacearchaeota archaeon]
MNLGKAVNIMRKRNRKYKDGVGQTDHSEECNHVIVWEQDREWTEINQLMQEGKL